METLREEAARVCNKLSRSARATGRTAPQRAPSTKHNIAEGVCEDASDSAGNSGQHAEIRGRYGRALGSGTAGILSQNGPWALLVPPAGSEQAPDATLFNLETGERASVPPAPFFIARPLASDGSVLTAARIAGQPGSPFTGPIGIWRAGQLRPIQPFASAASHDR